MAKSKKRRRAQGRERGAQRGGGEDGGKERGVKKKGVRAERKEEGDNEVRGTA